LQENENGFKGVTLENRPFECLISDDNIIFLVNNYDILRILLDKHISNWIDYKEIAEKHGLALDDSGVTIQLQSNEEEIPNEETPVEVEAVKPEPKPKAKPKTTAKKTTSKSSSSKASTKSANSATKK
jgi:hypothetical protein